MKTGLIIFNLFAFLTSYAQDLDGDWMYTPSPKEVYTLHVGLRIKGDSVFEMTNSGLRRLGKYHLENGFFSYKTREGTVDYKLLKRPDTLILISNSGSRNIYHNRRLEFDPSLNLDKITFDGLMDRNGFTKIILSIDRNGKALFTGHKAQTTEHLKFKVDKKTINKMDSIFKWSFIKSTNNESVSSNNPPEFDLPYTITIDYNQEQKIRIKGTRMTAPYRVRLLYWFMLHELRARKVL